jgi:hypothetical protein
MNNEAIQPSNFGAPLARPLARNLAAAMRAAAGLLLAHVRETITATGVTSDRDELAGMNAHMLRDIGADGSIGPFSSANRDLQYPRL